MSQDRPAKLTHRYHLGGQILVVIFDLLDVCGSQFDMIIQRVKMTACYYPTILHLVEEVFLI